MMMIRGRLGAGVALACLVVPACVHADAADVPFVRYTASSATVSPEDAWSIEATISPDGMVSRTYCLGYDREGPGCNLVKSRLSKTQLQNILDAVNSSDLARRPARTADEESVGGDYRSGRVVIDGADILLPNLPIEEDRARVNLVLDAIRDELPSD